MKFTSLRSWHWSQWVIGLLVLIALLADVIANDKPLYCHYDGNTEWPVFKQYMVQAGISSWQADERYRKWREIDYAYALFPLIPYGATETDPLHLNYAPPLSATQRHGRKFTHWLGTDTHGRDVCAGLIHGARSSLVIGIFSMLLALLIGVPLGSVAGYFGNQRLQLQPIQLLLVVAGIFLGIFWPIYSLSYQAGFWLRLSWLLWPIGLALLAAWYLGRFFFYKMRIPIDSIVMRSIEVLDSLPVLLILLVLLGIFSHASIWNIVLVIGLVRWGSIAKYVRAEFMKIRDMPYMEAGRSLGFSDMRLMFRHAWPNAAGPVWIAAAFGVATAILAESTLSFLGIGLPEDVISWGKQLQLARGYVRAWWLAIFPGLLIFLSVLAFNRLAEVYRQRVFKS